MLTQHRFNLNVLLGNANPRIRASIEQSRADPRALSSLVRAGLMPAELTEPNLESCRAQLRAEPSKAPSTEANPAEFSLSIWTELKPRVES